MLLSTLLRVAGIRIYENTSTVQLFCNNDKFCTIAVHKANNNAASLWRGLPWPWIDGINSRRQSSCCIVNWSKSSCPVGRVSLATVEGATERRPQPVTLRVARLLLSTICQEVSSAATQNSRLMARRAAGFQWRRRRDVGYTPRDGITDSLFRRRFAVCQRWPMDASC